MSNHHSKTEPRASSEAGATMSSAGASALGPTPSANGVGGDVETARLAYAHWEARGGTHGSAEEDWIRAEQELKARWL